MLPENVSIERRQLLEVFGAEIILVARATRAPTAPCAGPRPWPTSTPTGCSSYQYGNEANPQAHYDGTGPEILARLPEITHFVAGLGTIGHADRRRART